MAFSELDLEEEKNRHSRAGANKTASRSSEMVTLTTFIEEDLILSPFVVTWKMKIVKDVQDIQFFFLNRLCCRSLRL